MRIAKERLLGQVLKLKFTKSTQMQKNIRIVPDTHLKVVDFGLAVQIIDAQARGVRQVLGAMRKLAVR